MYQVGRGVLLGLAIAGLAVTLYAFAFTVYTLLEDTPLDYIWGSFFILIVCGCVYYIKWLIGVFQRARRERISKWYEGNNGEYHKVLEAQAKTDSAMAALAASSPPGSMERLERDVHDWSTRGDTPGSLAGSVIGLEAVDEFLEGDM